MTPVEVNGELDRRTEGPRGEPLRHGDRNRDLGAPIRELEHLRNPEGRSVDDGLGTDRRREREGGGQEEGGGET
ncbi:hypothetical protein [Dietzia psychralcaliphila]|uniref:hypothetical protein n=1 Tax=Dietzia psychralcaliphila TaxID=139021 RepID=UPI001C1E4081|nr:hypothetical protein [Dietzia psychralcaliphila]